MEENKIIVKDLAKININFDDIDKWRKGEEEFPVYGFLSFYEACGLEPVVRKYFEEHDNKTMAPFDVIFCNFYTLQRIKNYLKDQWAVYSLDLKGDNQVVWKQSVYGKNKHYPRRISKKVEHSLLLDVTNYCPGIDDELEDNQIVFRIVEEEKE